MTREDLSIHLQHTGLTRRESIRAVTAIFNVISHELSKGNNAVLRGFGEFKVQHKRARMGRNPRTGEPAPVSARSVVKFKASKTLKAFVDKGTNWVVVNSKASKLLKERVK